MADPTWAEEQEAWSEQANSKETHNKVELKEVEGDHELRETSDAMEATADASDDKVDDFDDFSAFAEAGLGEGFGDDNEDFGDFGEFAGEVEQSDVAVEPTLESSETVSFDASEYQHYISSLNEASDDIDKLHDTISSMLAKILPSFEPIAASSTLATANLPPITLILQESSPAEGLKKRKEAAKALRQVILCTSCGEELWTKLSQDSVFYNPATGHVGQFQWRRSETRLRYLEALGIDIPDEQMPVTPAGRSNIFTSSSTTHLRKQRDLSPHSSSSSPDLNGSSSPDLTRQSTTPKPAEPELDLDIAKAYLELTEETLQIYPTEKLKSILQDLERLHRQSASYLQYLLDQRESLLMDSETYNDLISCIIGHAQKVHHLYAPSHSTPAHVKHVKKRGFLKRNSSSSSASASVPRSTSPKSHVETIIQEEQRRQSL